MPIGSLKNTLYGLALPVLGKKCEWKTAQDQKLARILRKHHVAGACIQRFENAKLSDHFAVGYAKLDNEKRPVTEKTVFRTASVAKTVTALLVFRLQTLGKISVQQDISELLGYEVRNPHCPDAPITLAMLLSHTSSIIDSPSYFDAFQKQTPLRELLSDKASYLPAVPGMVFRYSNFGAGIIGCLLEKAFGESLESLAQRFLFEPLGVKATFDASKLSADDVADSWRVLPAAKAFDAQKRIAAALPLNEPAPETHYLLAAGNLYLTAKELAKLTLVAVNGANGFLDEKSLRELKTPLRGWPEQAVPMKHGMGLLQIDDKRVYPEHLWGHQGFAYGAVNGIFFDAQGNGFICLNSGASERRIGHLALINRDLIAWAMKPQRSAK